MKLKVNEIQQIKCLNYCLLWHDQTCGRQLAVQEMYQNNPHIVLGLREELKCV